MLYTEFCIRLIYDIHDDTPKTFPQEIFLHITQSNKIYISLQQNQGVIAFFRKWLVKGNPV